MILNLFKVITNGILQLYIDVIEIIGYVSELIQKDYFWLPYVILIARLNLMVELFKYYCY